MAYNRKSNIRRNVVFFGETGTGKSSAINLILGSNELIVSSGAQPCTETAARQEITLKGTRYSLWDTRGLSEGRGFLQAIFGESSKRELEKFLKERHQREDIDLLVFCVHGARVTKASVKYYKNFCAITRRLAAPVVVVVNFLEKEPDVAGWWNRNSSRFEGFNMEFDDHACVSTLMDHPRSAECRESLVDLITKDYHWEAKETGSYFGSRVPRPAPSVPSREGSWWNMRKTMYKGNDDQNFVLHSSNTAESSTRDSFHTPAESPSEPISPNSFVESPTPRSGTTSERPRINTLSSLRITHPQPLSDETSGTGSPSPSIFSPGSQSIHTSRSEAGTVDNEDHWSGLPFKFPADSIRRREGYATKRGTFGDIWECDLIIVGSSRTQRVAVKAVKTGTISDDLESQKKKLRRELKIWGKLQHRNVVPLLGVVSGFGPLLSMVIPWFYNESLSRFLAQNTLNTLKKNHLLGDIAAGLSYLHSQDIVHGDLHSDNVLIDDGGAACLTDFGLSFINEFVGTAYLKSGICGSVQFTDPAFVKRVNASRDVIYPTKACDVYSFGGVMLHVVSGKKPYDGISQSQIFLKVLQGEPPEIPTILPLWHRTRIKMCWKGRESKRPSAKDLMNMFHKLNGRESKRPSAENLVDAFALPLSNTGGSIFHASAESSGESMPSNLGIEPLTPHNGDKKRIYVNTDLDSLRVSRPQPLSGETLGTGSSLPTMLYPGHPEVSYQPSAESEDNLNNLNGLIFQISAESIRRRKFYSTVSGTFGDIWECDLIVGGSSQMVAVKALKTASSHPQDVESQKKKLHRELRVWKKLQHKNIVPLLGVVSGFGPLLSMVSPWFCNESLSLFLAQNTLNIPEKICLLRDVTAGLSYLHSQDIVHGDLHSDNVLIDEHGTACLTDFGHSFISEFVGTTYLKSSIRGNIQFMDPEFVRRVDKSWNAIYPTEACDVYSFGGVVLHVISGKKPYDGIPLNKIMMKIWKGESPEIPTDDSILPLRYRKMIGICWDDQVNKRPSTEDLVNMFHQPY